MRRSRYACLLALAACESSRAAEPGGGMPPVPVQMEKVPAAQIRDASEYVATLRSRLSVQVQPQVAGYLTQIFVTAGTVATPDLPLMEIDPRQQQALVRSQVATRAANEANLKFWRQQRERVQHLFSGGAATRQDLDQAETSLRQAEAAVAASGQQVQAQSVQLRFYKVTAPYAGTVGDIPVRVGDFVTQSTLLTTLDDNEVLESYVDVPLERAAGLRMGMPVELLDAAGEVAATAEMSFISPRANADTQTILTKAHFPNQDGKLRSGQFTRARVIWGEHKGPAVPVLAIQSRNGQAFAWVVTEDRAQGGLIAQPRPVQVGAIQDQRYPITKGLAVGDTVVVSGVQKLRPGARVVDIKSMQQGPPAGAPPAKR